MEALEMVSPEYQEASCEPKSYGVDLETLILKPFRIAW
jgi:hypothetical protein